MDETIPGLLIATVIAIIVGFAVIITHIVVTSHVIVECNKLNKTIIRDKVYECKELKRNE